MSDIDATLTLFDMLRDYASRGYCIVLDNNFCGRDILDTTITIDEENKFITIS